MTPSPPPRPRSPIGEQRLRAGPDCGTRPPGPPRCHRQPPAAASASHHRQRTEAPGARRHASPSSTRHWTTPAPSGSTRSPTSRPPTRLNGWGSRRARLRGGPCGAITPCPSKLPSTATTVPARPGPDGAARPTGPKEKSQSPTGICKATAAGVNPSEWAELAQQAGTPRDMAQRPERSPGRRPDDGHQPIRPSTISTSTTQCAPPAPKSAYEKTPAGAAQGCCKVLAGR